MMMLPRFVRALLGVASLFLAAATSSSNDAMIRGASGNSGNNARGEDIPYEAPPLEEQPEEPPPSDLEDPSPPHDGKAIRAGDLVSTMIDQSEASSVPPVLTEGGSVSTHTVMFQEGAAFTIVHFSEFDMGDDGNCKMIVSGKDLEDGRPQQYEMIGKGKMKLGGNFWAQHVKGDTMYLRVECLAGMATQDETHYVIDQVSVGFVTNKEEQEEEARIQKSFDETVCGSSDQVNAICYSSHFSYTGSRGVARMLTTKTSGSFYCTGWLASSSNYFITNEHCVTSQTEATNTDFDFGAEASSCSTTNCAGCHTGTMYSGSTFITDNASLDYALLQLNSDVASTFGYLEVDNRRPVYHEQIYVVGHPAGRAKEISWYSDNSDDTDGVCRIQATLETNGCTGSSNAIRYYCDTEGGNSGSPVLASSSGKVIGLHNCGGCTNSGHFMQAIFCEIGSYFGESCTLTPSPTASPPNSSPTSPTAPAPTTSCNFAPGGGAPTVQMGRSFAGNVGKAVWNTLTSFFGG